MIKKYLLFVVFFSFIPNLMLSQNSFEFNIDLPDIYEYPIDLKQLNDGNYVSVVNRARPGYSWKELSILFVIDEQGIIKAQDSLISGDTIFNTTQIFPYENGIIAFGHFGFFSDTAWLTPIGQFIAYYETIDESFNLVRFNKYNIRDAVDNVYTWVRWPVLKPGTDTCFIVCGHKYSYEHYEFKLFTFNINTGDSLSLSTVQVPFDNRIGDLLITTDNSLNVYSEFDGNFYNCSMLLKYDYKNQFFTDTLCTHPTLRPFYSKAETLPNGNIVIAGQCDTVILDPFDIWFAYGVFLYDSNFNYIKHRVFTNFYEDTISQTAWAETLKVNEAGEMFILSNYYFDASPFSGKATIGYVAKIDSDLNLIWEDYFGGDRFYALMVVEPTDDGGVIICSHSNELIDTTSKTYSWFRKYTADGYVGVKDNLPVAPEIRIFPNPASHNVIIEAQDQISVYEVFDINGRNILSGNPNENAVSIDIKALKAGVYILKADINNKVVHQKFIIK